MKNIIAISLAVTICLSATCSSGQIWKQYADSAKVFREQKMADKAVEFYLKSIKELKRDSLHTISYANSCDNLAILYKDIAQYKKAETLCLEGLRIREMLVGKHHPDYATSCNNIADIYREMGQYEKAEQFYIIAIRIRKKSLGLDHPDYANSCNGMAVLYVYMGYYDKAEGLFILSKQIRGKTLGKNHFEYANSCNNLAALYMELGQYARAEMLYLEAKQIQEKVLGKEHKSYANSCNNLACIYEYLGRYDEAELLYLEGKQIQQKVLGKNHPDYARTCSNLANLYTHLGQYHKAESLLVEARQIQEEVLGKDHPDYANTCSSLALIYKSMSQFYKSEQLFIESKNIQYKVLGEKHPYYITTCIGLANLYFDIYEYAQAEQLYLEVKKTLEETIGKGNHDYATLCDDLASLYMYTHRYDEAESFFIEAKSIKQKILGSKHQSFGYSCYNLATLYRLMHKTSLAKNEYEASFFVNTSNFREVSQFAAEEEKAAYISNIITDNDNTLSFYISEHIKSGHPYSLSLFYRNLILSASQTLKKQLFSIGDSIINNKYNEWETQRKALSIYYSRPIAERREDVAQLEERAGQLEKELTRLSASFAKQQQRADWEDIKAKLQPHEAAIEFVTYHWINSIRRTDTVLYAAFILRKDSLLPAAVPLFNEKQLQELLPAAGDQSKSTWASIKALYTVDGASGNPAVNKSTYELIWKPLEDELKGINTVYFAPSGLLHRIAFAALPVNNTAVLSDRYKLVQLATTASVADQQPVFVTPADKITLYGSISYSADTTALKNTVVAYHHVKTTYRAIPDEPMRGGGWDNIPGTREELKGIASLAHTWKSNITSRLGINATEESVKALNGAASPGVIHFATHGFFYPDPKADKKQQGGATSGEIFKSSDDPMMRSGILLAGANHAWQNKPVEGIEDGILTAYEVANLYLPNTKLVVLSACETGLGDIQGNEGVYGLQRAFKIAGAQNLVMSLWKVPDAETAEFMQAFYRNLFAKQSISDAFYGAQKVMKNKYRSQPYKWAAWVLVH